MSTENIDLNKGSVDSSMWNLVSQEEKDSERIVRPSMTYWQDVWRRLKANKVAMGSMFFLFILLAAAVIGPIASKYSYSDQNLMMANQLPSSEHWFGTDSLGRDLFVRVLYGARISLTVGFVASVINLFIGVLYGGIAGYIGGKIDNIMMRAIDILYTIPLMLYVILLMVVFGGGGLGSILIALGLVYWIGMARIVRGQILSLKEQEYVMAAKTLGASDFRILLRHLIPNAMGPIIITMTMSIPTAIFTEAFLSFIGLGVSAPKASWGVLANDALSSLSVYPHQLFFPALAISITMLAFNFLGDGLRDALDPRMRK
ncbi:oligopeptide transport system permease protein [Peptoclostridium litorale DSM 5388]|uniref:Dipeptide transport system permease protein DppC n=1 Tax=Peptoclostridium litorale DSM 5388 TaxID=1121324 RepID=A0A069RHS3_PEPLI|nr:ABC transporter permease [Peptoclostridium litorale]KDR95685.1 dipeptide transport system permease protein DppC [Peptoclostridium litorale DSM 5388]SIO01061.1 oligopeptide transport system permease protein [Peptoclostridium litorale DSM 5388]